MKDSTKKDMSKAADDWYGDRQVAVDELVSYIKDNEGCLDD